MLELMLTRPEERAFVEATSSALQFLVLEHAPSVSHKACVNLQIPSRFAQSELCPPLFECQACAPGLADTIHL
jgi:hypothetical protein